MNYPETIQQLEKCVQGAMAVFPPGSPERAIIERQVKRARLERVLDACHRVYGDPVLDWLSWLDGTNSNDNHLALAELVAAGLLPHVITVNFDCLIEEAIKRRGLSFRTRCTLHPVCFPPGEGRADCEITKPHGSLWPDEGDRFRYLGATLTQVGTHVSAATARALRAIFNAHPTLLVAGYSDDDWDIMPALMAPDAGVTRLIWVQHSGEPPLKAKVWLERLGADGIAISGDICDVLRDVLMQLGHRMPPPASLQHPPLTRDASVIFGDRDRNALAYTLLLHDDDLKGCLLGRLGPFLHDAALEAIRLSTLASVAHTQRAVRRALCLNRQALAWLRRAGVAREREAAAMIWIGYEHLCLAKRPNWRKPLQTLAIPWHLGRGLWLLGRHGTSSAPVRHQALAVYYRTDLVHSWANAVMAAGPAWTRRCRWLFRWLAARYAECYALEPDLMEWEYYWLRTLEAQLLAGEPVEYEATRQRIEAIRDTYILTQNSVQLGNPQVYLALLEYLRGPNPESAFDCLDRAETIWRSPGNHSPVGMERVAIYRRFMAAGGW